MLSAFGANDYDFQGQKTRSQQRFDIKILFLLRKNMYTAKIRPCSEN